MIQKKRIHLIIKKKINRINDRCFYFVFYFLISFKYKKNKQKFLKNI